jgi:teichuronic acid biosynthesis glycosyltransferase TuaH
MPGTVEGGQPLVWFAGVGWNDTIGTDRRIVQEISSLRTVIWMDPPNRKAWKGWRAAFSPRPEPQEAPSRSDGLQSAETRSAKAPGLIRFAVPAFVGATRWPLSLFSDLLRARALRSALRLAPSAALVVANPLVRLPRGARRTRVLYITDDWVAGAPLMGLSGARIARILRANTRRADAIAAVSPPLLARVGSGVGPSRSLVLPNGAPRVQKPSGARREPIAGLIGQLNERTDIRMLQAVVDAGIPLRVIGPLVIRRPDAKQAFRSLLEHPLIEWLGPLPASSLPGELERIAVGLTPYLMTAFNLASSPLKTLEYLSSGAPVVSSDLPASAWLNTPHVAVTSDAAAFAAAVKRFIDERDDEDADAARRAFAQGHSWRMRAERMLALIDSAAAEARRSA